MPEDDNQIDNPMVRYRAMREALESNGRAGKFSTSLEGVANIVVTYTDGSHTMLIVKEPGNESVTKDTV